MEIDWWTLAIQTVNFLVVVWLLSRFLYRPVRRMIEAREASDRKAAEDAADKAQEAEHLRAEYARKLAEFDAEMRRREAELHETLQREREETIAAARKEADEIRATAHAGIEDARKRAVADLRKEIAALARELAERALSDVPADPLACLKAALARQEKSDLARMAEDVTSGGGLAIFTAAALPDETRGRMRAALAEALGEAPELAFETDSEVLGGLRLRLPHGELDASVSGRLDAAAKAMAGDDDDA
jgi:F-type H+-transporting ATPase subunit b